MAKIPRQWIYSPRPASRIPDSIRNKITAKADEIVQTVFKPQYVKPPPRKPRFNYIVDIYTKWHKNCLYFRAKFACPGPNALSPFPKTALRDLHTWRTGVSIWRTCDTPASGRKCSPTFRWKKHLTRFRISRFSILRVERIVATPRLRFCIL